MEAKNLLAKELFPNLNCTYYSIPFLFSPSCTSLRSSLKDMDFLSPLPLFNSIGLDYSQPCFVILPDLTVVRDRIIYLGHQRVYIYLHIKLFGFSTY